MQKKISITQYRKCSAEIGKLNLDSSAKHILHALLFFSDDNLSATIALKDLCSYTSLNRSTLIRKVKLLMNANILVKCVTYNTYEDFRFKGPNKYTLLF